VPFGVFFIFILAGLAVIVNVVLAEKNLVVAMLGIFQYFGQI